MEAAVCEAWETPCNVAARLMSLHARERTSRFNINPENALEVDWIIMTANAAAGVVTTVANRNQVMAETNPQIMTYGL